tara:strand:+ start:536 stop:1630 length:1095 start_codon:yes stop_codon:yes gene_type:complete
MFKKKNEFDTFIMRDGSYSIILGEGYYGEFIYKNNLNMNINPLVLSDTIVEEEIETNFEKHKNKLIKITYDNPYHKNDIENILREIKELEIYISIPDKKKYDIGKKTLLYSFISGLKFYGKAHSMITKNYNLYYQYITNEGNLDLQFLFQKLYNDRDIGIWGKNTKKKMYSLIYHMLDCLKYLQDNKIVHLDIKPENIIYNDIVNYNLRNFGKRFKLIDFGFADIEPFKKTLYKPSGTPGYIPVYYNRNEPWLPNSNPDDWNYKGHISSINPLDKRYSLYKSDIYSLGRTLHYLDYLIDAILNKPYFNYNKCLPCFKSLNISFKRKKVYDNQNIKRLIGFMIEEEIIKRFDIDFCFRFTMSYFN